MGCTGAGKMIVQNVKLKSTSFLLRKFQENGLLASRTNLKKYIKACAEKKLSYNFLGHISFE